MPYISLVTDAARRGFGVEGLGKLVEIFIKYRQWKDRRMESMKAAAVYSVFIGSSMIVMWIMFYVTGGIPEINSKPIEIGLHIIAEIITAIALIIGGIGLYTRRRWGYQVYLLSMGMLMYTLIVSPGYYLQKGELAFVWMFAAFIVFSIFFIVISIINKNHF